MNTSLLIAGNWKSNKTLAEAEEWLRKLSTLSLPAMPAGRLASKAGSEPSAKNVTVLLCVPFTLLHVLHDQIKQRNLPIALGAQDVSAYPEGAYTGEVSGRQIKEFADWVILGHSERRRYFGETDEVLRQKVDQAKAAGLKIIYCVPDDNTVIPTGVDIAAYEPVWAIGTGKAETPENAGNVSKNIKTQSRVACVIYGGSVTADNAVSFVSQDSIGGVLAGGASLDPEKFSELIARVIL